MPQKRIRNELDAIMAGWDTDRAGIKFPKYAAPMQRVEVMEQRDENCPIHQAHPFGERGQFAKNRTPEQWEWYDADKQVCSCQWEKAEAFARVSIKGRKERRKACKTCHLIPSAAGFCLC